VHVPLTSYDALDTGRAVQFSKAYRKVMLPAIAELVESLAVLTEGLATELQIGRTHGQHALPVTVGFWLATILHRIVFNWEQLNYHALCLPGKISGAVGAYNAQSGLNFDALCLEKTGRTFEERVLEYLELRPAPVSTQILPPEPLAYYLFSVTMLSASLAQLGRDCRHLMRSEIGEVVEAFEAGQVGSSTMAHKRNPINFESLEGMFIRTKNEFGKVTDTLISEHQRDLVGSSVARDFPIILVNLMTQINTLLRKDAKGSPFIRRISVNREACRRNFEQSAHLILAEPLYIALQMAGYRGDAHELVNHKLVPTATKNGSMLIEVLEEMSRGDQELAQVIGNIPSDLFGLLYDPDKYVGKAAAKTYEIVRMARDTSRRIQSPEGAEGS
jgi:adenylosuccinate lyase